MAMSNSFISVGSEKSSNIGGTTSAGKIKGVERWSTY